MMDDDFICRQSTKTYEIKVIGAGIAASETLNAALGLLNLGPIYNADFIFDRLPIITMSERNLPNYQPPPFS
jgi:hypothetical protein